MTQITFGNMFNLNMIRAKKLDLARKICGDFMQVKFFSIIDVVLCAIFFCVNIKSLHLLILSQDNGCLLGDEIDGSNLLACTNHKGSSSSSIAMSDFHWIFSAVPKNGHSGPDLDYHHHVSNVRRWI